MPPARSHGQRLLPDWHGTLRTIKGVETVKMPAVAIRVYKYETGQFVTKEIGRKPSIEELRFRRLWTAFHIRPSEIDQFSGECHLLIGLKSQSLQISKLARFKSEQFPDVGI